MDANWSEDNPVHDNEQQGVADFEDAEEPEDILEGSSGTATVSGDVVNEDGGNDADEADSDAVHPRCDASEADETVDIDEYDAVPDELKEHDIWLLWDSSSETPRRPHWRGDFVGISWSNPDDWHSYEEAVEAARERESWGIGYVNALDNEDAPRQVFSSLDVDGVLDDNGDLKDWCPPLEVFIDNGVYVERSPSGKGLRIPLVGYEPPEWWTDIEDKLEGHQGVEVHTNKFNTITGDKVVGSGDEVGDIDVTPWLEEVWARIYDGAPEQDGQTDLSNEYDGDGFTEEVAHGALEYVNPDVSYGTWRDIGFALVGEFGEAAGSRIFRNWSRRGSKWDRKAEKQAERIVSDADKWDYSAGTVVYHAKQGGWEPDFGSSKGSAEERTETPDKGGRVNMDDVLEDTDEGEGSAVGALSAWLSEYKKEEEKTPKKGEKTQEAARALLEYERFATVGDEETVYRYHGDDGVWRDDGRERIRRVLDRALGSEFSTRVLNETVERVRARTAVERDEFDVPEDTVPVENGLLDLETRELRDLRPKDYATSKLPVEYDENADCPQFRDYLEGVTRTGSDRDKLQEYAGYVLMHGRMPHHKALFLAGPQASGKSTFIDVLSDLLPDDVVGASTPHQLTRRFGKMELYESWLNVSADIPSDMIENLGTFKMLVGKDLVAAEMKGVQEKVKFIPTTKHVFSANQLPEVYDADDAFWRRILIVPFPETIPRDERVDNFDEQLLEGEAAGIFNWVLEGYDRLNEQGGFTADRTPEETRKLWMSWSTPVIRFYARCLRDEVGAEADKEAVYKAYKEFCEEEMSVMPVTKKSFGKRLCKFPHIDSVRVDTSGRGKKRVYQNVRLRDDLR